MPIGVLERACVAAPECIVWRVSDRRACSFGLRHDCIHFGLARDIVAERALSRASRAKRNFGFMGERCAGPNGELQPVLEIEEGDRAMLELRADDPLRRQTEPIAIKSQRSLQIVNTESNDRDPWLHLFITAPLKRMKHKIIETSYFFRGKVSTEGVVDHWQIKRWDAAKWG